MKIELNGSQLAAILAIEQQVGQLNLAAQVVGARVGEGMAVMVLANASEKLEEAKKELIRSYGKKVVVAQPSDVSRLVAP